MEAVLDRTALSFETHPARYRHWKLAVDGPVARLTMQVQEDQPLRPGYALKLNSYDLGVDIELADAVQRLRFEHPEVGVVVLGSERERVFCAGANIKMLGQSAHAFKVNFCKFTNETRLAIEDAQARSGQHWIAALSGTTAGGGYELAMACDEILLVDDGHSAVSLPEVPLLGVLPGTGGLTRLIDKRKVRRDRADVFCTLAEGLKASRALEWGLVDAIAPRSRFDALVAERVKAALARRKSGPTRRGPGVSLTPVGARNDGDTWSYSALNVQIDREGRTATLTLQGPTEDAPARAGDYHELGERVWILRVFRELDDALLRLRFNESEIGLLIFKSAGEVESVLAHDRALDDIRDDWFVREIGAHLGRVLRRLDGMARSLFALVEPGSCCAGSLLEVALACDRVYARDDAAQPVRLAFSPLNDDALPMWQGLTRLKARFQDRPEQVMNILDRALRGGENALDARAGVAAGIVTVAPDALDWDDEVRVAIEERASLSPDALTALEANLRFPGPETTEAKIFGRLTAWQNWIFQRPNAVGEFGALKCYGEPQRPRFDWNRT